MLSRQYEIQFRRNIYIYTRIPQIEHSTHKKLRVFYFFEFAGVAVTFKSTDRIFPGNHVCSVNILSVEFAYIYIYIYLFIYIYIRNDDQSNAKNQKASRFFAHGLFYLWNSLITGNLFFSLSIDTFFMLISFLLSTTSRFHR